MQCFSERFFDSLLNFRIVFSCSNHPLAFPLCIGNDQDVALSHFNNYAAD
jgi:hypothetical protein